MWGPLRGGAGLVPFGMWGCIKTNLAIFGRMNIHLPVIWGEQKGTKVLTHCHVWIGSYELQSHQSHRQSSGFYRQTLPSKPGIGSTLFCRLSHGEISPTTCSWDETPKTADVVRYGWWYDSCLICSIHVYSKNIMVKTGENM